MPCEKCSETRTNTIESLSRLKGEISNKYVNSHYKVSAVITDVCCFIDKIIDDIAIAATAAVQNVKIELEVHLVGETSTTNYDIVSVDVKNEIKDDLLLIPAEPEPSDDEDAESDRHNDDECESSNACPIVENEITAMPTKVTPKRTKKPRKNALNTINLPTIVKPWRQPKPCTQCHSFVGTWRQRLQHRIKVHDLQKPFKCEQCPMTFYHPYMLKNHSATLHREIVGKRPYVCEICSKVLSSKHGLKTHKLSHSNERPYECDICACKFKGKKDVAKHMKVHSDNRSIVCEICSKTFKQRESFRFHMNTHYGIKPNKCRLCSKGFLQKSKLDRHMLSHTGERPVKCPVCNKGYTSRYAVKHHLRMVHKIQDVEKIFARALRECEKYGRTDDLKT